MAARLRNKRCSNFTLAEEKRLLSLVLKYKERVENRKTDSEANRIKREAWLDIEREFNYMGFETYRPLLTLKKKYENCKKLAKVAMKRQFMFDREEKEAQRFSIGEQIKQIINDQLIECKSEFDDCEAASDDTRTDNEVPIGDTLNTAIESVVNKEKSQEQESSGPMESFMPRMCSCTDEESIRRELFLEEQRLNVQHIQQMHSLAVEEQNEKLRQMKERHQLFVDEMKLKIQIMKEEHLKRMELMDYEKRK